MTHFARSGYAGADLDAIAADIGCSKGTLYRYYRSKSDLFERSVDGVMRGLLEATSASTREDPLERLEEAVRSFLAYFDGHPEYVELLIQERAVFRDRQKPTYFKYREARIEGCKADLHRLMVAGRVRRMPAERALDVVGDMLYGAIFVNYFARRRKSLERQAEDLLDVLFRGLLTPRELARRGKRPRATGGKTEAS